ncbi:MAG: ribonuclease T [Hyphomicrobiaceae bacterium]
MSEMTSSACRWFTMIVALFTTVMLTWPAEAQRGPGPGGRAPYEQGGGRNVAGRFDYYALVLSWSPTYCAGLRQGRTDPQCHRRDGRRFAFVLHGLWPQHERGWPEYCPTRDRPYVPQRTIDRMLDIMPSSRLVIHEYKKHGTCSGLDPDGYYALSRQLFQKVRIPPRYQRPNDHLTVATSDFMRDFMEANPGLKPDMLAVSCGGPGNRLREIRICFTRNGAFRSCGRNEDQRRLCSASKVYLPPARSDGRRAPDRRDGPRDSIPRPRSL